MLHKSREQKYLSKIKSMLDRSTEILDTKTLTCLKVARKKAVTLKSNRGRVESKLGHRSEFSLEISSKGQFVVNDNVSTVEELKDKRILIADDIAANLEVAKNILNQWGIKNIYLAKSSLGVLHQLESSIKNNQPIDIVLLDMCMSQMKGLDMEKIIRNDIRFKGLKIVMLSLSDRIELLEDNDFFDLVYACLTKTIR